MDALNMLLGGFARKDFFDNYWDKRSLHLPHGDNRFAKFTDFADFADQRDKCAISKVMYRDKNGDDRERLGRAEDYREDCDPNVTLCNTYMQKVGLRGEFLDSLTDQVKTLSDYYFNCYYSPEGHGYCLHFDPHPVWLLQVKGSKAWSFASTSVCKTPQQSILLHDDRDAIKLPWGYFTRPDPDELNEVILNPGDVLYIPAGTWHKARAHKGSSLALTLAHARSTTLDLFSYMLQRVLQSRTNLVERMQGRPTESQRGGAKDHTQKQIFDAADELRELFNKLLSRENFEREFNMHIERKKNFPQFYQIQFKAPPNLQQEIDAENQKDSTLQKVKVQATRTP